MVLTVANFMSVPAIVTDSDLLGLAPERLARVWARGYPIRIFDLPIAVPEFPFTMVWHLSREGDPGQRWIRDLISRELGTASGSRRRRPS